jgi:hypothetical protein
MIENLPQYISTIFIITTFLTVGIFLYAVKRRVFDSFPAKLLTFLLAFWIIFQTFAGSSNFYLKMEAFPPRLILFGVLPALLLIAAYFIFARKTFVEKLPLQILTLLHIVRIPVEIVLLWLFQQKLIPQVMTFEGRNFDILAGITAPVIAWLAFRDGKINRPLLIIWNVIALGLLINIVTHAILSFPFPFQQIAFDQPNRAILYFPFAFLPTIIVPIVLFAHLTALWQMLKNADK